MRLSGPALHLLFTVFVASIGPWASAQEPPAHPSALGLPEPESTLSFVVQGRVLEPDGRPAVGAVVLSSAGGQATTDGQGGYRLALELPLSAETLQISAVGAGGRSRVASASVAVASGRHAQVAALQLVAGGACVPSWLPTFGSAPGVDGTVYAQVVFDDGNGLALYVAGSFPSAGDQEFGPVTHGIARWNGSNWTPVGGGLSAPFGVVYALAVHDDGGGPALYAGGEFTNVGGTPANRIARWDGSTWSALGTGLNAGVRALAEYDAGGGAVLVAGGFFTTAGGVSAGRLAQWDGTSWAAFGPSLNGEVRAMIVHDDGSGSTLFIGGDFSLSGPGGRVARWNGSGWSDLDTPPNGSVRAFAEYDDGTGPALYVGGEFSTAFTPPPAAPVPGTLGLARWDGVSWSSVGGGMNSVVHGLTVHDDGGGLALFAGGPFTTAGGTPASRIARWDGVSWSGLGSGSPTFPVESLVSFDDGSGSVLVSGGRFTTPEGIVTHYIGQWDGTSWNDVGNALTAQVWDLAVYVDGAGPALHAAGQFTYADGRVLLHVARWTGSSWESVGGGTTNRVRALAVHDDGSGPALFAGGSFLSAGGSAANRIARWDGTSWTALGSGTNSEVHDLVEHDDGGGPALFACGSFTTRAVWSRIASRSGTGRAGRRSAAA